MSPMNIFLIGTNVEIHHYPDWTGTAFLSYEDAEYRIPAEVAKILVDSIRGWESGRREGRQLEEKQMECAICGGGAGNAWLPSEDEGCVIHAICDVCSNQIVKARRSGVLNPIPEIVDKRGKK